MTFTIKNISSASLGFIFALLLLLFLSMYSFVSFEKSYENVNWVRHTSFVLQTSTEVLSNVKDAETSVRGYVITGKEIYLEPWQHSVANPDRLYNNLKQLTADNPDQQLRIGILNSLIAQKYKLIQKTIAIRKQGTVDDVIEFSSGDKGKLIMDSIRTLCAEINDAEQRYLKERTREMELTVARTKLMLIIGTIISVVIFIITFIAFHNQLTRRRKNAAELFNQNEVFTQMLLSLGDGVITTDTSGIIKMINRASCDMSGWNRQEAVGQHIEKVFDIVHEITGNRQVNPALAAMKENKISFLENGTLLTKKDGSQIAIDDSGAPIHDKNGNIIGSVLIFRDVTGKKKAEQELKIFHKISRDMIGIAGMDGYFKTVNPAFSETLGYTTEEFMAKPFLDFVHPEDVQKTLDEMETLSEGKPTISFTNRYRCKDGDYRWLEWNATPFGNLLYAVARDTTARQLALEEISNAYKKFYQMLESNPVAIVITEIKGGRVKYANDGFCELSGFSREELLGRKAGDMKVFTWDDSALLTARILKAGGHVKNLEWTFKRKGEDVSVLFSVESIEVDGKMCFLSSLIDISERKKNEQEILNMNETLEKRVETRTAEIQKQKKFIDDILNKIPTEIAVYDSDRNYIYVNPTGIKNKEIREWIIGRNDYDYCKLKGNDNTIADKRMEAFERIKIKDKKSVEWIDEYKNGDEVKYMLRILQPLENNEKFILIGYDITELKEAEHEKQEYITALEKLMFMTSHKVRHPLSQILGLTNLLDEDLTKDEFKDIIRYTKESILSLGSTTKELTVFINDLKRKNRVSI